MYPGTGEQKFLPGIHPGEEFIHLFIQYVFIEHLLHIRHYSRPRRHNSKNQMKVPIFKVFIVYNKKKIKQINVECYQINSVEQNKIKME